MTVLAILLMGACKKSSTSNHQQKIVVVTTIPKSTTFQVKVTDKATGEQLLSVTGATSDGTYSVTNESNTDLSVQYRFITQGQSIGQGTLDITCNGQSLLHANGGYSDNYTIKVP